MSRAPGENTGIRQRATTEDINIFQALLKGYTVSSATCDH